MLCYNECFSLQVSAESIKVGCAIESDILVLQIYSRALFASRLHRTHMAVQCPCLKIYFALRDAETSVNNNHIVTSSIQQPPLQHKVQHTSLSILTITKNPI